MAEERPPPSAASLEPRDEVHETVRADAFPLELPSAALTQIELSFRSALRLLHIGAATRAFGELVRASRNFPMTRRLAAYLVRMALIAKTTPAATALLRAGADDGEGSERFAVRRQLARLHRRGGQLELAREALVTILAEDPADRRARRILNLLLEREQRWEELDASLEKESHEALRRGRRDRAADATVTRARLSARLGHPGQAALRYGQAAQWLEQARLHVRAFELRLQWLSALVTAGAGREKLLEALQICRVEADRTNQVNRLRAAMRGLGLSEEGTLAQPPDQTPTPPLAPFQELDPTPAEPARPAVPEAPKLSAGELRRQEAQFVASGRWPELAAFYRGQIARASEGAAKVELLSRLAEVLEGELHEQRAAAQAYGEMFALQGEVAALREQLRLLRELGDGKGVEEALDRAIERARTPDQRADAHAERGEVALAAGDVPRAKSEFLSALRAQPRHLLAKVGLAEAAAANGELRPLRALLEPAPAISRKHPGRAELFRRLGRLADRRDAALARVAWVEVHRDLPEDEEANRRLLVLVRQAGDDVSLEPLLRAQLKREPRGPEARRARMELWAALERLDRAADALAEVRAAVRFEPGHKEAWLALADRCERLAQNGEAAWALEQAATATDDSLERARTWDRLARFSRDVLRDPAKAALYLQRAENAREMAGPPPPSLQTELAVTIPAPAKVSLTDEGTDRREGAAPPSGDATPAQTRPGPTVPWDEETPAEAEVRADRSDVPVAIFVPGRKASSAGRGQAPRRTPPPAPRGAEEVTPVDARAETVAELPALEAAGEPGEGEGVTSARGRAVTPTDRRAETVAELPALEAAEEPGEGEGVTSAPARTVTPPDRRAETVAELPALEETPRPGESVTRAPARTVTPPGSRAEADAELPAQEVAPGKNVTGAVARTVTSPGSRAEADAELPAQEVGPGKKVTGAVARTVTPPGSRAKAVAELPAQEIAQGKSVTGAVARTVTPPGSRAEADAELPAQEVGPGKNVAGAVTRTATPPSSRAEAVVELPAQEIAQSKNGAGAVARTVTPPGSRAEAVVELPAQEIAQSKNATGAVAHTVTPQGSRADAVPELSAPEVAPGENGAGVVARTVTPQGSRADAVPELSAQEVAPGENGVGVVARAVTPPRSRAEAVAELSAQEIAPGENGAGVVARTVTPPGSRADAVAELPAQEVAPGENDAGVVARTVTPGSRAEAVAEQPASESAPSENVTPAVARTVTPSGSRAKAVAEPALDAARTLGEDENVTPTVARTVTPSSSRAKVEVKAPSLESAPSPSEAEHVTPARIRTPPGLRAEPPLPAEGEPAGEAPGLAHTATPRGSRASGLHAAMPRLEPRPVPPEDAEDDDRSETIAELPAVTVAPADGEVPESEEKRSISGAGRAVTLGELPASPAPSVAEAASVGALVSAPARPERVKSATDTPTLRRRADPLPPEPKPRPTPSPSGKTTPDDRPVDDTKTPVQGWFAPPGPAPIPKRKGTTRVGARPVRPGSSSARASKETPGSLRTEREMPASPSTPQAGGPITPDLPLPEGATTLEVPAAAPPRKRASRAKAPKAPSTAPRTQKSKVPAADDDPTPARPQPALDQVRFDQLRTDLPPQPKVPPAEIMEWDAPSAQLAMRRKTEELLVAPESFDPDPDVSGFVPVAAAGRLDERNRLAKQVLARPLEPQGYRALSELFTHFSDGPRSRLMQEIADALEGRPSGPLIPARALNPLERAGLRHPALRNEFGELLSLTGLALCRATPGTLASFARREFRLDSGAGARGIAEALLTSVRALAIRAPDLYLSEENGPAVSAAFQGAPKLLIGRVAARREQPEGTLRFHAARALFSLNPELLALITLGVDGLARALELLGEALEDSPAQAAPARLIREALGAKGRERVRALHARLDDDLELERFVNGAVDSVNRAGLVVAGGVAPALAALESLGASTREQVELIRFAASERYLGIRENRPPRVTSASAR